MELTQAEAIVLSVLARQPASGYDLARWLDLHGLFLGYRASLSPIYRTLGKLERRGFLSFEVQDRGNGPEAKVYRLTADGTAAVLSWARSPFVPSPRPMDADFTLRFVLAGQFGRDITIDVLRTELHYRRSQKATEDPPVATAAEPIPELDASWCREVQLLAHERGYASTAAYIAWLELTLARLEN